MSKLSWNRFFHRFFEFANEYRSDPFCDLLGIMECNGSDTKPDTAIFSVILCGLVMNPGITDKMDLVGFLLYDIMPRNGICIESVQCHAKIAAFWRTEIQIPISEEDRFCITSYEALRDFIAATSDMVMISVVRAIAVEDHYYNIHGTERFNITQRLC